MACLWHGAWEMSGIDKCSSVLPISHLSAAFQASRVCPSTTRANVVDLSES